MPSPPRYVHEPRHEKYLKEYSQKLRREMTKEEKHLWYDCLKRLPVTAKRQQMIGPYIVDFYIASAKLIIELDGSQHGEEEIHEADLIRDQWLTSQGYRVMRFPNQLIHTSFDSVCDRIGETLGLLDGCGEEEE